MLCLIQIYINVLNNRQIRLLIPTFHLYDIQWNKQSKSNRWHLLLFDCLFHWISYKWNVGITRCDRLGTVEHYFTLHHSTVWIAANYCTLYSSYVMYNVNWYKRNTNNHLIEMLNPMFYQYNRQWTIAIKHRKRIAEWEILVEKNNKIDIFAIRALYMILIGHVLRTPGDNIICPIEGFRWNQQMEWGNVIWMHYPHWTCS